MTAAPARHTTFAPAQWFWVCVLANLPYFGPQARGVEIAFIRAQIQQRTANFSTVDYSWKATSHFTPEHAKLLGATPFDESRADVGNQFPMTFEWEGRLQCDSAKMRLEHNRPTWMFAKRRFEQHQEIETFDGQTAMSLSARQDDPFPLRGGVSNDPPSHMAIGGTDFGPVLCHFRSLTYPGMIFDRVLVDDAQITDESLEGRACAVVRRRNRTPDGVMEDALWLDPMAAYAARRWTHTMDGRVTYDIRVELEMLGDHAVPKKLTREDYSGKITRKLRQTTVYEMTAVRIGDPIDVAAFHIVFPPGTTVSDGRAESAPTPHSTESAHGYARSDHSPPIEPRTSAAGHPAPRQTVNPRMVIVGEDQREYEFDRARVKGVRSADELLNAVARGHRFRDWVTALIGGGILLVGSAAALLLHRRGARLKL